MPIIRPYDNSQSFIYIMIDQLDMTKIGWDIEIDEGAS